MIWVVTASEGQRGQGEKPKGERVKAWNRRNCRVKGVSERRESELSASALGESVVQGEGGPGGRA